MYEWTPDFRLALPEPPIFDMDVINWSPRSVAVTLWASRSDFAGLGHCNLGGTARETEAVFLAARSATWNLMLQQSACEILAARPQVGSG